MSIAKTKKAQALLIVIVITNLMLLMVLAISDRLMLSQYNIQRSFEFDKSLAVAENRVNEIRSIFLRRNDTAINQCLNAIDTNQVQNSFTSVLELNACQFLRNRIGDFERRNLSVFAKRVNNSSISVSPGNVLTLNFVDLNSNLTQGISTQNIRLTCNNITDVVVTRVFLDSNGNLLVDKGILNGCNPTSNLVQLYSNAGILLNNVTRQNTVYISVRNLNNTSTNVLVEVLNNQNVVASSSKYEFVVTGVGGELGDLGVGSDVPIKFELGAGSTYITSDFLDYVLFERP